MERRRLGVLLLGMGLALPAALRAQDEPTTASTTVPATAPTTQAAGKMETPPPGFIRVTVGQYSVFCLPVDEGWVKQSLNTVKPAHLPTTRPADILAKIPQQRDAISKGMAEDLGIDAAAVAPLFDSQLIPQLTKLDQLKPPVVFLVITEQKLISLLNADWKHPRVSYNRLMDQVRFDDRIMFSIETAMDESLLLANYEAKDDLPARMKKLREAEERFESDSAFSVAARGRVITQGNFMQFVEKEVFTPMKLRDDQTWLQLGIVTQITAKYAPMLTGVDSKKLLADLIYEHPNAEPKADKMNLLKLPDLSVIQPQYRPAFIGAARRKSTLAIQQLVDKAGPDAIRKTLDAVRKTPPADGKALVALINTATAVDVQPMLEPAK